MEAPPEDDAVRHLADIVNGEFWLLHRVSWCFLSDSPPAMTCSCAAFSYCCTDRAESFGVGIFRRLRTDDGPATGGRDAFDDTEARIVSTSPSRARSAGQQNPPT